MNTQALQVVNTPVKTALSPAAEAVKSKRADYAMDNAAEQVSSSQKDSVQPEELLNNIKSLTEDGLYSVRFEMNNQTQDLIINLVSSDSGEVIRQIPPEEIIDIREYMKDLRGNIVSIES